MKNLPEASFYEIALVFLGSRHKYICEGRSMNPTLKDGEVVLVERKLQSKSATSWLLNTRLNKTARSLKESSELMNADIIS